MCPKDSISASVTRLRATCRLGLRIPAWPTQPSGLTPRFAKFNQQLLNNLGSSLGSHWQTQAGKQGKQRQQETGKGRRRKWVSKRPSGHRGPTANLTSAFTKSFSLYTGIFASEVCANSKKKLKIKKPTSATHDLKWRIKEKSKRKNF